jgi:2,3-bisphosphoglycerate-independent phosphoglycerate mutase
MRRKLLFCIADGMADWPIESLNGRTVLDAARTPTIDALSRRGLLGLCRTVPPGMAPGSDVANMSLLGFDPSQNHTGRGPIEAAAQGLELAPDDLVWRCNLVTVSGLGGEQEKEALMRDYSSGHIDTPTSSALIAELKRELDDETFTFHPGVQYRHLLVQKGGANAPEARLLVSPPHDITDKPIAEDLARFASSPRLERLFRGAAEILAQPGNASRANAIWPWGQGKSLLLPDFKRTFGLTGAVISAVDLIKGLGRAAGMRVIDVEGATGLLETNYEGKVTAALEFLSQGGDFVFIHLEGPDECGHGGDLAGKLEAVERFDARVLAPLVAALPDAAYLVACDHPTPIALRTHTADPVPFLLSWPGCGQISASLTEASAADAGLEIRGCELLNWVLTQTR